MTSGEVLPPPSAPTMSVLDGYRCPPGVYDEVYGGPGTARPHWQLLLSALEQLRGDDLTRRSLQADRILRENGVTFNVFGDSEGIRPWKLDLVPGMADPEEWESLQTALSQRARLITRVVQDVYGGQSLLKDGVIPAEAIFAHPRYYRAFAGLAQHNRNPILLYAAELARSPRGEWHVMADRTDAPVGLGFALENRIVTARMLPQLVHRIGVQRLAPFFIRLKNALRLESRRTENSRIVLLSPGPKFAFYFEDVYLARYMGLTLVEGSDLAVRDDQVFIKTLAGLQPVDVIFSRGVERGIDPLEQGGASPHGVPGLLQAIRKGNVAVANGLGSGLTESPVFMSLLPRLCEYLLGEPLRIPSIATWWCGDAESMRYVQDNLREMVIKPAFQASGGEEVIVAKLSAEEVEQLRKDIASTPYKYVAQETIERSALPVWGDQKFGCGHVALRAFAVAGEGGQFSLMPGGLARVAPTPEPMELSILAGERSKDLWVPAHGPVPAVSLLEPEKEAIPLKRTGALFPSRVADNLFWLGQSLERGDFLGRLLRSTIDRMTTESELDWPELPILIRALADQGQIEAAFAVDSLGPSLPRLEESLPRQFLDPTEPRSLANAVTELRRLTSSVRDWLSFETWKTIHEATTRFLSSAAQGPLHIGDILTVVDRLIVDLASVSGLINDGMIRGPSWRLLDMGRRIERGRNIAGLLLSTITTGKTSDKAVLKVIVEVLDCRMTYRSRYVDNVQQNAVFDLAVTDETNPHSVAYQVVQLAEHVDQLPRSSDSPLRSEEKRLAMAAVHTIRMLTVEQLATDPPEDLESALNATVLRLKNLSDHLTRKYLVHSGPPRQITRDAEGRP